MVLWDGSVHRWCGPGQPPCCLIAAIDDATSRCLVARFFPSSPRRPICGFCARWYGSMGYPFRSTRIVTVPLSAMILTGVSRSSFGEDRIPPRWNGLWRNLLSSRSMSFLPRPRDGPTGFLGPCRIGSLLNSKGAVSPIFKRIISSCSASWKLTTSDSAEPPRSLGNPGVPHPWNGY